MELTKRQFFAMVIKGENTEEMKAYARDQIAALDKLNETRKEKPTKKQKENEPILLQIMEIMRAATAPVTSLSVAFALGISTQKASALLTRLTAEKLVTKGVPDKEKHVTYLLPTVMEVTTETPKVEEAVTEEGQKGE